MDLIISAASKSSGSTMIAAAAKARAKTAEKFPENEEEEEEEIDEEEEEPKLKMAKVTMWKYCFFQCDYCISIMISNLFLDVSSDVFSCEINLHPCFEKKLFVIMVVQTDKAPNFWTRGSWDKKTSLCRENALDQRFVRFSPLLQANFPSDRKRQLVVPTIQYMKTFASFTLTTRVLKESVASSDQTYQRTASPSKLLESCRRWGKGFY